MKRLIGLLTVAGFAGVASAQVNIAGGYNQNFDSVVAASAHFSATIGVQNVIPGLTSWRGVKRAGTGTTATAFNLGDGSGNSGGLYGFRNTGSAEYALGSVASGSNAMAYGVELQNNGSAAIISITISFTQENWRSSTSATGTPNTVNASYARSSTSAATASDFLTSASNFSDLDNLDLVGPTPVTTNGALNGNDPLNQTFRSQTIVFAGNLAVGESVWLRWQDVDDQGNDAGLAIDNLTIEAVPVPEPASLAALGLGAVALARRRRK